MIIITRSSNERGHVFEITSGEEMILRHLPGRTVPGRLSVSYETFNDFCGIHGINYFDSTCGEMLAAVSDLDYIIITPEGELVGVGYPVLIRVRSCVVEHNDQSEEHVRALLVLENSNITTVPTSFVQRVIKHIHSVD